MVSRQPKRNQLRRIAKLMKSAVSDGGEDQGAEQVTVMGRKKAKNHHVSFGKSRLARSALPFSAPMTTPMTTRLKHHNKVSKRPNAATSTSPLARVLCRKGCI